MSLLALIPHAPWDILLGLLCLFAGYKVPPFLSIPLAVALALVRSWIRFQAPHPEGLESLGWIALNAIQGALQLGVYVTLAQVGMGLAIWLEHSGASETPRSPSRDPKPAEPGPPRRKSGVGFSSWEDPHERT